MRTYLELSTISDYEGRFNYLRLDGAVGAETFGFDRYLNQTLYRSYEWKKLRNQIIIRDNACDMGLANHEIMGRVYIHHINPITMKDIEERAECIFDPNNLVCVSQTTHNAIHYGDEHLLLKDTVIERRPNDICPWRIKE